MALRLIGEIGFDGSGFQAGLRKLQHGAGELANSLKGAVVAGVGIYTVEQAIHKTIQTAKELVNASQRLAIAPEQLQVLRKAASESGVELDKVTDSFEKLDVARQRALTPGKKGDKFRRAFHAAGIDAGASDASNGGEEDGRDVSGSETCLAQGIADGTLTKLHGPLDPEIIGGAEAGERMGQGRMPSHCVRRSLESGQSDHGGAAKGVEEARQGPHAPL